MGPDTAAVIAAHVNVERANAFRRLMRKRLAVCAGVAWLIETTTPLLPRIGLVIVLALSALVAAVVELAARRAARTLRVLLDRPGAGAGPRIVWVDLD
jgi:hypothetical protein